MRIRIRVSVPVGLEPLPPMKLPDLICPTVKGPFDMIGKLTKGLQYSEEVGYGTVPK